MVLLIKVVWPDLPLLALLAISMVAVVPASFAAGSATKAILVRRFIAEHTAGPISLTEAHASPEPFPHPRLRPHPHAYFVSSSRGTLLAGPVALAVTADGTSLAISGLTQIVVSELSNGLVVYTSNAGRIGPPAFIAERHVNASWDELLMSHESSLQRARSVGLTVTPIDNAAACFERQEEAERCWVAGQQPSVVISETAAAIKSEPSRTLPRS